MFNYIVYLFGAVSLFLAYSGEVAHSLIRVEIVAAFIYCCSVGQVICALRRGIWYLRDQMHYCWICYERLLRRLDSHH